MTKAEILVVVNARLNRNETDIDTELISALYDISSRGNFLNKEGTRSTAAGINYYSLPANYKDMSEIIIDTDEPIERISHNKFLILIADDTSTSEPRRYAIKNGFIWLEPNPDTVYVMTMFYSIFHPNNVDKIEFDEIFRECIYEGTMMKICEKFEDDKGLQKHGALFEAEIQKRLDDLDAPIRFTRYNDL